MSLINQMLKDLESRRSSGDLSQRAVEGMGAAARDRQKKQSILLLGLVSLIVVLASISGYLLLQEEQTETTQQAAVQPQSAAGTAEKKSVKSITAGDEQPAKVKQPSSQPLVKKQKMVTSAANETMAGMTMPDDELDDIDEFDEAPVTTARDAVPARISKRLHPQSDMQLAEQEYQRGYTQLQRGDKGGAEDAWRKALSIDASHIASRESLAILYLSQSRRIEAAEQLQKGLAVDPGNTKLALLYARMQLDAEDTQGAVATLEKAMQKQQQNADFYAFTAAVYQRQGDFEKSIAAYQAALKQQPKQAIWWMGLGISLEGAGKAKEALAAYSAAKKSSRLAPKLQQYVEGRIRALE